MKEPKKRKKSPPLIYPIHPSLNKHTQQKRCSFSSQSTLHSLWSPAHSIVMLIQIVAWLRTKGSNGETWALQDFNDIQSFCSQCQIHADGTTQKLHTYTGYTIYRQIVQHLQYTCIFTFITLILTSRTLTRLLCYLNKILKLNHAKERPCVLCRQNGGRNQ